MTWPIKAWKTQPRDSKAWAAYREEWGLSLWFGSIQYGAVVDTFANCVKILRLTPLQIDHLTSDIRSCNLTLEQSGADYEKDVWELLDGRWRMVGTLRRPSELREASA